MSKAEQLARRVVELFAFTRDPNLALRNRTGGAMKLDPETARECARLVCRYCAGKFSKYETTPRHCGRDYPIGAKRHFPINKCQRETREQVELSFCNAEEIWVALERQEGEE